MITYKLDTHVHTSQTSPCGKVDAKELVHLYKEAGYDGLVITDHYYRAYFENLDQSNWEDKIKQYLQGYHNALAEGKRLGLTILLGMEIRFDENENDYLVYGLDEDFLYKNKQLYTLNLQTFYKLIQNTSIRIYQAHPFRPRMIPADPHCLHGIEIYNGNPRHNSNNQKAYDYAQQNQLQMISGSDFHQVQDIARGGIVLPEAPTTCKEFAQILKEDKIIGLLHTE